MRKYIRNIIRRQAEDQGFKPSKCVRATFDSLQRKKYGAKRRVANILKGTHKRKLWRNRLNGSI